MATGKITKRNVDALLPGTSDAYLWDEELKGFGLKVTPSGGKAYLVQYRLGGRTGKVRRVTIGQHGSPWTAEAARKEALAILGDIARKIDVAEMRREEVKEDASASSVANLARRFLDEYVATKCKPSTAQEYRRIIERFILPAEIGRKKVKAVTRADVARLHHSLRSTPRQANHMLAVFSKMMTLAELWGERPDNSNPCRHVEKNPETRRERMLSAEELARLGDALAVSHESPHMIALIKLLVFTGARLSEVQTMRWEWIDFERGEARLPDSKTGRKTIHLPAPALDVLASLPRLDGNPHVICGERPGAHMIGVQRPWQRIRAAAGLGDLRIHDLRHAFASIAASSGMGLPIIGRMLGHTQAQTTQRYAHLASDPVKAAAATVASKIAEAMNGSSGNTGEVVPLGRRS
jgi:integrase